VLHFEIAGSIPTFQGNIIKNEPNHSITSLFLVTVWYKQWESPSNKASMEMCFLFMTQDNKSHLHPIDNLSDLQAEFGAGK